MPAPASAAKSRSRRKDALCQLRREEIVAAAIKLFGRKGFDATRAEEIAQAAGLAKGTLYLYFKSKEAIYTAAVTRSLEELGQEIARQSAGVGSFAERFATAVRVRLEFWPAHEGTYRLLLTVGREPKLRRQTNALVRAAQQGLLLIFTDAVAAGELAPGSFEPLAWAALDMVRGATERRMDRQSSTTVEADAAWIVDCLLKAVRLPRR